MALRFGWDKLRRFLATAHTWTGLQTLTTLNTTGTVHIGDTANANVTLGLTINQSTNDDAILALKSGTDVAHAVTDNFETDSYGDFRKTGATSGGLSITGVTDADAEGALTLRGVIGAADPTDTNSAVVLTGAKLSSNTYGALGAAEEVLSIKNHTTDILKVTGNGTSTLTGAFLATAGTFGTYVKIENDGAGIGNGGFLWTTDDYDLALKSGRALPIAVDYSNTASFSFDADGNFRIVGRQITAGTGTGITVNQAGAVMRQVYKVTTTYAAYSDTDTKKGIVIATLPAKTKLVGAYSDTTAAYTGGAVSATTLVVGVTAEDGSEIIAVHDVFTAPVTKGLADADMGTSMTRAAAIQGGYLPSWTGTTAVYATLTTTTANTNALTAGSTTFYLVTERF